MAARMKSMDERDIEQLIARQRPWHSLEQAFYTDPEIYRREVDRILLRSWLYAGHVSEIPDVGDYMLLEFANESVIIIRAGDDKIYALVNVCRHRGSRICFEKKGSEKRLTCRYHGWTYGLDGMLRAAAHMPENFDKSGIGLKKLHLRVFQGLVFVNFAEKPGNFPAWRRSGWTRQKSRIGRAIRSRPTGNWRWRTTRSATTVRQHIPNIRRRMLWPCRMRCMPTNTKTCSSAV